MMNAGKLRAGLILALLMSLAAGTDGSYRRQLHDTSTPNVGALPADRTVVSRPKSALASTITAASTFPFPITTAVPDFNERAWAQTTSTSIAPHSSNSQVQASIASQAGPTSTFPPPVPTAGPVLGINPATGLLSDPNTLITGGYPRTSAGNTATTDLLSPPPTADSPPPSMPPPTPMTAEQLAALVKASSAIPSPAPPPTCLPNGAVLGQIPLGYTDAPNRTGAFYLPSQFRNRAVPLLLVFHGMRGSGQSTVNAFMAHAEKFQFAVVGVDSHNIFHWETPNNDEPLTTDVYHALACLDYVMGLEGVRVRVNRITPAGISMGGYMAASIASHNSIFRSALIIHSKWLLSELGPNPVRMWLSTGVRDSIVPPWKAKALTAALEEARPDFPRVSLHVYLTGHCFACRPQELNEAIRWWLTGHVHRNRYKPNLAALP